MSELKNAALVTGGAGFIGSNLVERLLTDNREVHVFDDLSAGSLKNLEECLNNSKFTFHKVDLKNQLELEKEIQTLNNKNFSVYHLAGFVLANIGAQGDRRSWNNNVDATYNLLEALRKSNGFDKNIYFSSSGSIYGSANVIPTPENYGPLLPISIYAAGKLACEAMISTYCNNYKWNAMIFRFANVVGKRQGHGVIFDFINKLKKNPKELEILGDGMQSKSYLHVDDCISAIMHVQSISLKSTNIFNLASRDATTVDKLAQIVIRQIGLEEDKVRVTHTGGLAWAGDVTKTMLDTNKIRSIGYAFSYNSDQSIELAVKQLIKELN